MTYLLSKFNCKVAQKMEMMFFFELYIQLSSELLLTRDSVCAHLLIVELKLDCNVNLGSVYRFFVLLTKIMSSFYNQNNLVINN